MNSLLVAIMLLPLFIFGRDKYSHTYRFRIEHVNIPSYYSVHSKDTLVKLSTVKFAVIEKPDSQPLIGCPIKIMGEHTDTVAISDIDGIAQVQLKPGKYLFNFSYFGSNSLISDTITISPQELIDFNAYITRHQETEIRVIYSTRILKKKELHIIKDDFINHKQPLLIKNGTCRGRIEI